MPIIVIPVPTLREGLQYQIILASEETLKKFMEEGHHIYEYTVAASFLKKYLLSKGYTDNMVKEVAKKVLAEQTETTWFLWDKMYVVQISDVKEVLSAANLSYHEFIDAYCTHLKSL
jgi:hypothetical protein